MHFREGNGHGEGGGGSGPLGDAEKDDAQIAREEAYSAVGLVALYALATALLVAAAALALLLLWNGFDLGALFVPAGDPPPSMTYPQALAVAAVLAVLAK